MISKIKAAILARADAIKAYDAGLTIQFKHTENNLKDWQDFNIKTHIFGPWDIVDEGEYFDWRVKPPIEIRYVAVGCNTRVQSEMIFHTTGCYTGTNSAPFEMNTWNEDGERYNVTGKLRLELDSTSGKLLNVEMVDD